MRTLFPLLLAPFLIAYMICAAPDDQPPAFVEFAGGVSGAWLRVERHNLRDYEKRAWDPSFTTVTSDFKPIVSRLKNGKYAIEFESLPLNP